MRSSAREPSARNARGRIAVNHERVRREIVRGNRFIVSVSSEKMRRVADSRPAWVRGSEGIGVATTRAFPVTAKLADSIVRPERPGTLRAESRELVTFRAASRARAAR